MSPDFSTCLATTNWNLSNLIKKVLPLTQTDYSFNIKTQSDNSCTVNVIYKDTVETPLTGRVTIHIINETSVFFV